MADALSRVRVARSEILCMAISVTSSELPELLRKIYQLDQGLKDIVAKLKEQQVVLHYQWLHDLLSKNGKLVVGPDTNLRSKIMQWHHSSPESDHSGGELTLKRIKSIFYWKGLTKDVKQFVRQCRVCQMSTNESIACPRLLQPMSILEEVWVDISMDFITGLPKSGEKRLFCGCR